MTETINQKFDLRKYSRLVSKVAPPLVINTKEELERADTEVGRLLKKGYNNLSVEKKRLLALLSRLIEDYEDRTFLTATLQRRIVARRLERVYNLACSTNQLARFVIFGSFVTAKHDPNDVDIFLLMEDAFDTNQVTGEAAIIFDHTATQNIEGASVFWIRRMAAIGGEEKAMEHWQIKRDKTKRGIVEVISDDQERSGT